MNQESVLAQFEMPVPLAAAWAIEEEQKILRDGVSLSEREIGDARVIGVQNPDQVRLLQVEEIQRPSQSQLKTACEAIDFLTPATRGGELLFCESAFFLGGGSKNRWDRGSWLSSSGQRSARDS